MRTRIAAALLALCLGLAPAARGAEPGAPDSQVVLRADRVSYDQAAGRVVASGNVEVARDERILLADEIVYDERADTLSASGNVSLLEPTGEVLFADHIELSEGMKRGVVRDIRILLTDGSRFAANGALRTGGNRTEMRKAVFSPCRLCPEHRDRPPLWQLKAERVVHDQRRQDIEYSDVVLEVFGVPVAYSPYFSHPDPTVRRRSGFLTPTYGTRSQLGLTFQAPYFFNLAPHRDATFEPIFTSKEGVVLVGEYRERLAAGQFRLAGSVTRPESRGVNGELVGGREIRGHIEGSGRFDLSDTWRAGFGLERATDDTYLRRYGFDSTDTLTSRLYLEGIRGRNYAAVNGFAFQGLEVDDDPGETPLVLPIVDYAFISEPAAFGAHYTLDANFMALRRNEGTDSRRLSVAGAWRLPTIGPAGDITTLTASLRGDLYWVNDVKNPARPDLPGTNGLTGRVVPLLALDWSYPWVRRTGATRQTIEPVVKFVLSPYGGNPDDIPNEDSQDFEFDDTNLFSLNRFPGLDRIEGGPRLSYGVRSGIYGIGGSRATVFIGQSFRVKADSTFEPGSGLEDNRSDFVGRVYASYPPFVDFSYRFRLDRDDLSSRRSEIDLSAGPEWLRLGLGFLSLDDAPADLADEVGKREELSLTARAAFGRNWTLTFNNRRDLTNENTIETGVGIGYQDECILVSAVVQRRFTRDRDFEPDTSVRFTVNLKHLG